MVVSFVRCCLALRSPSEAIDKTIVAKTKSKHLDKSSTFQPFSSQVGLSSSTLAASLASQQAKFLRHLDNLFTAQKVFFEE